MMREYDASHEEVQDRPLSLRPSPTALPEPQKPLRISFGPAPEAEKSLGQGVHEKRRNVVVVERAAPRVAAPALRERDTAADGGHDVFGRGRHRVRLSAGPPRAPIASERCRPDAPNRCGGRLCGSKRRKA